MKLTSDPHTTIVDLAPGPGWRELLRSLPGLRADPLQFIHHAAGQYGDIVRFQVGGLSAFLINHPDGIQRVLQDNPRAYTKDTIQYHALAAVTGKGLLTSDGEVWLRHRRLMQPAFHRQRIAGFGPLMVEAAVRMLQEWEVFAAEGQVVDIDRAMMRLTLEILGKALLGVDLSRDAPALTAAVVTVLDHIVGQLKSPPAVPGFLPTAANRSFSAALRTLDRAVEEIIANHRQHPGSSEDLLSLLIQAGEEDPRQALDARALRDEVITVLIAGHETVASALTWACYLLSQNELAAGRMQAELRSVLNGRTPAVADLAGLEFTRRVFDETLRLYPPAWLITRKCIREDVICGWRIPPGSLVIIGVAAIQRHPRYWADPDHFDPERFAAENAAGRPRYAYIPFGGGPRLCIGNSFALAEAPLILASIFQRFRLELAPGVQVVPEALVTLRPRGGLPMRLILV